MRIYQTLRKRGLALFLALIMCLSLVQVPAFAAEDDASEPADAPVMDVTGPGVQEPEAVPEEESPAPESEEIAAPDTQEEPEADEPEEYAPEYAAVEELEAAFEAAVEALEDGGVEGGIAALEEYLNIFDRLSPEDQEANQEAREAAVDYLQTLLDSLEGIEDENIDAMNTYDQITVRYVVNGVTLRTDTLNSGRYIQIANRVPYVSDLIAGTAYEDYDYGTVTKIECRPLQYFPSSALNLHEGQNIEHSGNYKTHTITYTTSKWEKHDNSSVTDPGTSNPPGTSGGSGSYFLQVVYVNKSKTEYSFGPRIASNTTARIWYYDNRPQPAPEGYELKGWQTSHYHGTNGFLNKGWWQIFGGSEGTRLYVYSGIQSSVALNSGEGVYLIYQATEDPAPPATYSYLLTWDYNGGTLNGKSSDQETAMNLTGDNSATHTFYEQVSKRPSRTGYIFTGWSYSGNGNYNERQGQIVMTGRDGSTVSGTMVAQWSADSSETVTLTYDANGGTNQPAPQTVSVGGDAVVADKGSMTKPNCTFLGWSTNKNATESDINPNDVLRMDESLTIYAVWEENPVPEAKTISVTPLVTFEVEGKDATQLAADQIPENYQMTLTYTDLDGKHERTLSKADATVTTEGNLGLPVLTWSTFDVKIAKESGVKIDIAVQQNNYQIGDNSEIIYNRTYTTDGGSQSDGAGIITVSQAVSSVKATTKNYYKLPDLGTPNLTITKSADKDIVKVGETVTYTITVANTGKAAATNVVVSDTLPKGLEWVQDNDASYKGGVLTWNIPQIEAGGSKSVSFTAKVTQSGAISNTARVTGDEIKTPVDSDPEDITGVKVSIKTTKSHSNITVAEKTGIATIPYTVTVKNTGDDLFGLDIIDKLTVKVTDQNGNPSTEPVKVTYKDLKVDGQTVPAEMSETGGIVNAIARDSKFAAGQTVTLTYNIEVQNKGQTAVVATLSNTATGGSWSTNPSGGRMFRMARDGEYDVTDSASDTASVGDSASVVIPPPQAETVTITVKFMDENGNEVGKTETTVEKNGSYDVTEETKKVPDGYEANGNPTGDVKGTADTDKVVTVPVKKTPAPPAPTPADWGRLTLTKTANKTQARAGEDITYTIRVTNNTGKDLTGIRVSEPLDTNVTFKSAAPAGYDAASGVWTIVSLANGASATLTLTVTVKDGVTNATIRNTAAITDASTTGPDPEKLPDGTRPGDTADVTVPEADARRVTVTWLNWNGDRLDRADWNTDEREPSYSGRRPTRPDSSRYTYTFAGWGNREVDEDGNVTYTALFDRERIDDDDDRPTGGGTTGGNTGGSTGGTTTIPDTQTPLDPGTTIIDQEVPLAGAVGLNDADHFAYVIGYEDGTVRPLNNISRAEVATIFFRLMTDDYRQANWSTVNSFSDVKEGDWYNNAISTCARAGALKGRGDGSVFDPNANITRAEFAVIAARFLDSSYVDDGKGDFADTADHWAAKEIRLAAKAGWVNGNGNTFNPDAYITRAEVMAIVNRMLDRTPDKDHMLPDMKKWTDNPEDAWYYEAVQEATNEHDYTRDETAVESWTLVKEHRDWAALELGWAANGGASAPQGETETQGLPDGI